MAPSYKLWRAELKASTPQDRRADRTTEPEQMSGFWRINGARIKPDWPVAIWTEADRAKNPSGATIFQIGRKMMRTDTHPTEWQDFISGSWLKCTAVEQVNDSATPRENWSDALESGRWLDGKPAREVTNAERADFIPSTPAEQGGNAPIDENGNAIDPDWLQIKENLARDIAAIEKLGAINSLEVANKAAEIIERMRANGTEGEKRRKAEKKPHDDAAAKVQAKWTPILTPASVLIAATVEAITKFKRAEEKRLRDEQEKQRRAEQERIKEEERKKLEAEAAQRAAQSQQMGMEVQEPSAEEIEREAAQRAAEQMQAMPQAETTVRVGTAHGRGINKATVKKGKITDLAKFFDGIKDHVDTKAFLEKKVNALARANAVLPGMEIVNDDE